MLTIRERPTTFEEIIGQEQVIEPLLGLENPKLSIFYGPSGVGKTTTARVYAQWLNCLSDEKPCGSCENCKNVDFLLYMWDVPARNKVDDVLSIIQLARSATVPGAKRVILADEVHGLTPTAFDKLLYFLESETKNFTTGELIESPSVFIFTTTEIQKVPETIRSRAKMFRFRSIPRDLMKEKLLEYGEEEAVDFIVKSSNGNLRSALQMVELIQGHDWKKVLKPEEDLIGKVIAGEDLFTSIRDGISKLGLKIFVERLLSDLEDQVLDDVEKYRSLIKAAYSVQFSTSETLAVYHLYQELEKLHAPSNAGGRRSEEGPKPTRQRRKWNRRGNSMDGG